MLSGGGWVRHLSNRRAAKRARSAPLEIAHRCGSAMSKKKSFAQGVWEALHPGQHFEQRRWVPRREEPRWKRLAARRREERRWLMIEVRRQLKKKSWAYFTREDWEAFDRFAEQRREEWRWSMIEARRLKREVSQRFARDRAVQREKERKAERAKRKTIPSRTTLRYGHRYRSVWAPTPIRERPWARLLAKMVPGTWYSRPVLRSLAPDVALNFAYGTGRPYLDRARKTTPDMKHPPGFLALFRLNAKGEALRAAFFGGQVGGGRKTDGSGRVIVA